MHKVYAIALAMAANASLILVMYLLSAVLFSQYELGVLGVIACTFFAAVGHLLAYSVRHLTTKPSLSLLDYMYLSAAVLGVVLVLFRLDGTFADGRAKHLAKILPVHRELMLWGVGVNLKVHQVHPDSSEIEGQSAAKFRAWFNIAEHLILEDTTLNLWAGFLDSTAKDLTIVSGSIRSTEESMRRYLNKSKQMKSFSIRASRSGSETLWPLELLSALALVLSITLRVLKASILYFRWHRDDAPQQKRLDGFAGGRFPRRTPPLRPKGHLISAMHRLRRRRKSLTVNQG